MNLLYQSILLTSLDAGEIHTVNAALSHYQAHCRKAISQGAKVPFLDTRQMRTLHAALSHTTLHRNGNRCVFLDDALLYMIRVTL